MEAVREIDHFLNGDEVMEMNLEDRDILLPPVPEGPLGADPRPAAVQGPAAPLVAPRIPPAPQGPAVPPWVLPAQGPGPAGRQGIDRADVLGAARPDARGPARINGAPVAIPGLARAAAVNGAALNDHAEAANGLQVGEPPAFEGAAAAVPEANDNDNGRHHPYRGRGNRAGRHIQIRRRARDYADFLIALAKSAYTQSREDQGPNGGSAPPAPPAPGANAQ